MGRKAKQEQLLPEVELNGKLLDTTVLFITVPEKIEDVEIRKLDNGEIRLVKDDLIATGETMEDAIKNFKRVYKNQL